MRPLLATVLCIAAATAAPVPKALKQTATIEGDWRWESLDSDGKVNPPPKNDFLLWRVSGDTMQLIREGDATKEGVYTCRFTSEVRPDAPRTFEYKVDVNGYHRLGICELDGDTLKVAFGSDAGTRPTELKSGPQVSLYTFKRVKEAK